MTFYTKSKSKNSQGTFCSALLAIMEVVYNLLCVTVACSIWCFPVSRQADNDYTICSHMHLCFASCQTVRKLSNPLQDHYRCFLCVMTFHLHFRPDSRKWSLASLRTHPRPDEPVSDSPIDFSRTRRTFCHQPRGCPLSRPQTSINVSLSSNISISFQASFPI